NNINDKEYYPILINSLGNAVAHLTLLIEKLKAPPKAEMLKREEIDCNAILHKVIRQIKPALKDDIIIKEDFEEIPLVVGDADALAYVLKNLIINSIEAIRGAKTKGTIICTTSLLKNIVPEDTFSSMFNISDIEKYSVCITIKDDGPGIKKDFLEEKLFRPFNTTKEKGIGLGLYQCKTLIEGMEGKIFCKSEENKGTTFFITL
ncbi:MAG: HAMP domain-containing histidine kinase, partial [Chitinispirillaceae bacterium]|nr:HAMP domain-containing histidine kinase [Chitinispirillaceae bacterium]